MFGNIPQNVSGHSPEYLATFPGMFEDILSPEYNMPLIPPVFRIPFPVPVFLILYIAILKELLTYLLHVLFPCGHYFVQYGFI